MPFQPAPRLQGFDYRGPHRYFLTICTRDRAPVFVDPAIVDQARSHLLRTSQASSLAVIAYCFMPDHMHALLHATAAEADLRRFVKTFKQCTSFHWKRARDTELWQRGYFDRVLRDDEGSVMVARYILNNPVRAGLVAVPEDYIFQGSLEYSIRDLLDSIAWRT